MNVFHENVHARTERRDFLYLDLLVQLLHPRGIGNKAVLYKQFEVHNVYDFINILL